MISSYTSDSNASAKCLGGDCYTMVEIVFLHQVIIKDNLDNKKEAAMLEAMMKA